MLSHESVWQAIDRLAKRHGLSPSGLAKLAGLDATSFNPAKRDGRWPSTHSISKVLSATNTTLNEFLDVVSTQVLPLVPMSMLNSEDLVDHSGFIKAEKGAGFVFNDIRDRHAYAIDVDGSGMEPLYREGTLLVASPSSQVSPGDRVVARLAAGCIKALEIKRIFEHVVAYQSPNSKAGKTIRRTEILWMTRILWASQ